MPSTDSCAGPEIRLPRFVQPVLLALLAATPMHGYVLMQKLGEIGLFEGALPDRTGMYRNLRLMERMGMLSTVRETSSVGQTRKIYSLTEHGRESLANWRASLTKLRGLLDRVIALLSGCDDAAPPAGNPRRQDSGTRPDGTVSIMPRAIPPASDPAVTGRGLNDRDFVSEVRRKAMTGAPAKRIDLLRLLSWDPASQGCAELGRQAGEMADRLTGGTASVWVALDMDRAPCPAESLLSFFRGPRSGKGPRPERTGCGELRETGRACGLILYGPPRRGQGKPPVLPRLTGGALPRGIFLASDAVLMSPEELEELRSSGVEGVWHRLRPGADRDTPFAPARLRDAFERIAGAGLQAALLTEIPDRERCDEEIADAFLAAQSAGVRLFGVAAAACVPGGGSGGLRQIPEARLAQVAAVIRLCGGPRVPCLCVLPPVPLALAWGANAAAAPAFREEPRLSVQKALKLLSRHGWLVTAGPDHIFPSASGAGFRL